MSRIAAKFEELSFKKEGALVTFLVAGDPTPHLTLKMAEILEDSGVDMIELGLPFSDPVADGSTIQASAARALQSGMNTDIYFALMKKIREKVEVPLICLSYFNPILKSGISRFITDCALSGVDGLIIPDLPVEEAREVMEESKKRGLDMIFLATPVTTEERFKKIVSATSGFLYLVSLLGVTGVRKNLSPLLSSLVFKAKGYCKVPVVVGFGVSEPRHILSIIEAGADGAIVGSALVKVIEENLRNRKIMLQRIGSISRKLKTATKIRSIF